MALSYVPIEDGALFEQADAVVSGRIDAADDISCTVTLDEVIKGDPDLTRLRVFVADATSSASQHAVVVGAPDCAPGESVLLFLARRADGTYRVSQLALGVFHLRRTDAGEEVLVRALARAQRVRGLTVKRRDPEVLGGIRQAARFRDWLRGYAAGAPNAPDYWIDPRAGARLPSKYRLGGPPPARWFEFDAGSGVPVYAADDGQGGLAGGDYSALQAAVSAWNADPLSDVQLLYQGTTSAGASLHRADGINAVAFNDPLDEIPGSFDCRHGGVVATSVYRYAGSRTFQGAAYATLIEFDVVLQDGAGCLLAGHGGANAAEVLAHELGHGLGIAHSCGDGEGAGCDSGGVADAALMRATLHADGRGAWLGFDDCEAVRTLYPAPAGASGTCGATWGVRAAASMATEMLALLLALWLFVRRYRQRASLAHCR